MYTVSTWSGVTLFGNFDPIHHLYWSRGEGDLKFHIICENNKITNIWAVVIHASFATSRIQHAFHATRLKENSHLEQIPHCRTVYLLVHRSFLLRVIFQRSQKTKDFLLVVHRYYLPILISNGDSKNPFKVSSYDRIVLQRKVELRLVFNTYVCRHICIYFFDFVMWSYYK